MNVALNGEERLVVMLEARISEFEKRMKRAEKTGSGSFRKLQAGSRSATAAMEADMIRSTNRINQALATTSSRLGTFGKAFAGGLVGGAITAVFAGLSGNIAQIVKGMAQVGDEAKRSGLGLQTFQEWKFVAEQNRVGIDALVDGFKELNLRADEWIVTGKGPAAEAFARLGFSATELQEKLQDPSALMLEIIGRLRKLDTAARIRIADELFGGSGGEQFVQLIDQGEEGLRRTIGRAHELGAVLSKDAVEGAAELDRKFGELTTRASGIFKQTIVDIATMVGLIEKARQAAPYDPGKTGQVLGDQIVTELEAVNDVSEDSRFLIEEIGVAFDALSQEANALVLGLSDASSMMAGLGNTGAAEALSALASRTAETVEAFGEGSISGEEMQAALSDVAAEAQATIAGLGELDQARLAGVTGAVGGLLSAIAAIPAQVAEAVQSVRALEGLQSGDTALLEDRATRIPKPTFAPGASVRPKSAPALLGEPDLPKAGRSSGGGGGSADGYAQRIAQLQAETAALTAEAAAFASSAAAGTRYGNAVEFARTRAELLTAAQQQGMSITPELEAQVNSLAEAYTQAGNSADEARDRLEQIEAQGQKGADAIGNIFAAALDGADAAKQAVADLLMEIAKVQIKKAAIGLIGGADGDIAQTVGKWLSFDGGGYTGDGARTGGMDGKGGFLAMVHPNETVIDHTKGGVVTAGGGSQVNMNIDARGAQLGVATEIAEALQAAAPQIVAASVNAMQRAQARGYR
jgi:hypothetical protein